MSPEDFDRDGLQLVENVAGAVREVGNPGVAKHAPWSSLPRDIRDFWRHRGRQVLSLLVGVRIWGGGR